MNIKKKTSLQTAENVKDVLDWKLQQLEDENLPVEAGLADYIALGMSGYDDEIAKLKEYKKKISEAIRQIEEQRADTGKQIAEWLEEQGVDKLKGVAVSSVTIKEPSVSITKKIVWDIDKEEAVEKGLAHYEENIKKIPAGIRVNKKRGKDEVNT